ncbi:hypothetical protein A2U01_0107733, partial [Trifolium medium]|nr:hypothetical protein [Trifolium medium]
PLFMDNVSDTAGISPPAQSVEIPPDTKSETDGVGGPTIKINVNYSTIHLFTRSNVFSFC